MTMSLSSPPSFDYGFPPLSLDDDDDLPPFSFDVGVTIARKKKLQQQQHDSTQKQPHHYLEDHEEAKSIGVPRHSSLQDFLYGASLYILCLSLPTILGITARLYQKQQTFHVETYVESYYDQFSDYLCRDWSTYFCPPSIKEDFSSTLQAPDPHWTDVGIVAVLSVSLAILRLALVHLLVPRYLAPERLEVLVRCKSVHLLSSSYPKSLTPQSSRRTLGELDDTTNQTLPAAPALFDDDNVVPSESPPNVLTSRIQDFWHELERVCLTWRRSARRVLGVEPKKPYDRQELQDTDRLFTAPRYATAVFRLLYCIGSCTCALVWLRDAYWFPPAVGGSGSTRNCWDLKGGVCLESDSVDFDQHNAVLRKYFLVQASYHFHSWATHWVSLFVLWWYGQSIVSIRKSMFSYWRALLQHLLALAMIGACYFFSSLRRLGAICIFALDVSSLFVHLLQLCINAPTDSWLHDPQVIAWIHRGLVIPVFLYMRFYVFPFVVWYSAVFESRHWLRQMEQTLIPGSANAMKLVFHGFMLVNILLNMISFRRLLFHPHLQSVCRRQDKKDSTNGKTQPSTVES